MADPIPTNATDLDVLTELFRARQHRLNCERDKKEAAASLKAAKEHEADLLDQIGGHVYRQREKNMMPKLDWLIIPPPGDDA
jgi:hypothetical protein